MVKILKKLNFDSAQTIDESKADTVALKGTDDYDSLLATLKAAGKAYFTVKYNDCGIEYILFKTPDGVVAVQNADFMFLSFASAFMSDNSIEK